MKQHLKIVALQANNSSEEVSMQRPEQWQQLGFDTEQLSHIMQKNNNYIFDLNKSGELLKKYVELNRRNNINIILYTNAHMLFKNQCDLYDRYASFDANGNIINCYGEYPVICQSSEWPEFFAEFLYELRNYDIDGIFFDGPISSRCRCPRCNEKFQQKYGHSMQDAQTKELREFSVELELDFRHKLYNAAKKANPAWKCYFNEYIFNGRMNAENQKRVLQYNDLVGSEAGFFFYGSPYSVPRHKCAVTAKILDSVAQDKTRVIFIAGDRRPWSYFRHEPGETVLCYASTIANGASVWYGFHSDPPPLDGITGDMFKEILNFDKNHSNLYENSKSLAEIAVWYSFDTACLSAAAGESSDFYNIEQRDGSIRGNYQFATNGAYALLTHLNIPFDIISDINDSIPERIKAVVMPNSCVINAKSAEILRKFVAGGGTLIADGEPGITSNTNQGKSCFNGSSDIFGFTPSGGIKAYTPVDYMKINDDFYFKDGQGILPMTDYLVETEDITAEIIAKAYPPVKGSYSGKPEKPVYPFILQNNYGKGKVYYIGGNFFECYKNYEHPDYRNILKKMLPADSSFELVNADPGVEISVRSCQDESIIISLTNYTSTLRPIVRSIKIRDIILKAKEKYSRITAVKSGIILQQQADGSVKLPELEEYEVIHLQK